ncbi:MAG: hypothetical protein H7Z75_21350 [Ferruginibacter sp.]|nr:hypothetical protein [Cytophagales bacterium]
MYTGLKHFHSYWAYLVVLTLAVALVNALVGLLGNQTFNARDRRFTLFALIAAHLQFVFGLILYFVSPVGLSNLNGSTMKDSAARLYALEHPLTMIIVIALVTIGYSRAKRSGEDKRRFRTVAVTYSLAFVLMMSRIPWNAWLGR